MKRQLGPLLVWAFVAATLINRLDVAGALQQSDVLHEREIEDNAKVSVQDVRAHFKLPKMFDFARFKAAFHKSYDSALEEMLRLKLYLGRSYEVFISAVQYRYRLATYYKAINQFADLTTAEFEAMRNKHLSPMPPEFASVKPVESNAAIDVEPDEQLESAEPEELLGELNRIKEHANEPRFAKLASELSRMERNEMDAGERRKRRSVPDGSTTEDAPRDDFRVEQAFRMSGGTERDDEKPPRKTKLKSNNPSYEPPELMTRGSSHLRNRDYTKEEGYKDLELKEVVRGDKRNYDSLPVKGKHTKQKSSMAGLTSCFMSSERRARKKGTRSEPQEDDVVWVDHRESGCFNPVEYQGICGSCYAFSALAYLEWIYCNETGEKIKFSQQYLIDCGRAEETLLGCVGGNIMGAARFVSNFGIELAEHYPYLGYENTCPYSAELEMEKMGYFRMDVSKLVIVEMGYVGEYLQYTPMIIYIHFNRDFLLYGGGVYDGRKCRPVPDHCVVVIGHGREDGEEYWLLRNSFGKSWGEAGHMKLNKNSNCILHNSGVIYGSEYGNEVHLGLHRNVHVEEPAKKVKYNPFKAAWQNTKRACSTGK